MALSGRRRRRWKVPAKKRPTAGPKPRMSAQEKAIAKLKELARTPVTNAVKGAEVSNEPGSRMHLTGEPEMAASVVRISHKERDRVRAEFVEARIVDYRRAGKKVPLGFRGAFHSKSPTAKAWENLIRNTPERGRSGASVVEEWRCPVLGRHRFTAYAGVRPYNGLAGNGRKHKSKPWAPGNFQWVKPTRRTGSDEAQESTPAERKALAALRREHREYLVARAKHEFGLDLSADLFRRPGTSGLYRIWKNFNSRCNNQSNHNYASYGGRGIEVEPLFNERSETGFEDYVYYVFTCTKLGPRPSITHTTERKDVDGNYERDNLTWATTEEQQANRREVVKHGMTAAEKAEARHREGERTASVKLLRQRDMMLASGLFRVGDDGDLEEISEDGWEDMPWMM